MRSIVIIESPDKLTRVVYTFQWMERLNTVLDRVTFESRLTTRHRFKVESFWDRLNKRDNRIEKPLVSNEIKQKALDEIRSQIVFGKGE